MQIDHSRIVDVILFGDHNAGKSSLGGNLVYNISLLYPGVTHHSLNNDSQRPSSRTHQAIFDNMHTLIDPNTNTTQQLPSIANSLLHKDTDYRIYSFEHP